MSLTCNLILLLFLCVSAFAHNGAVGIAVPVKAIVLDGDLSDWPAEARWYPIANTAYGRQPRDARDFSGKFAVGYDVDNGKLYLAIEVADESIVAGPDSRAAWDARDGCEVYVDVEHPKVRRATAQYVLYGTHLRGQFGKCAAHHSNRGHVYEWALDLTKGKGKEKTNIGKVVGIDVVVCDKDEDDSFSWVAWGPGINKINYSDRLGDVILVNNAAELRTLKGRIEWSGQGAKGPTHRVHVESLNQAGLSLDLRVPITGLFGLELPAGSYEVGVSGRGEEEKQQVSVRSATEAEVVLPIQLGAGVSVKAGPGRSVKEGEGVRLGEWHTWEVADGLPSARVFGLSQSPKGDLWIGTDKGLTRFNGETFTTLSTQDGLCNESVQCVLVDREGNVWAGTEVGLARYDGRNFTVFSVEDGLSNNDVQCLFEDRQGVIWIGTLGGGISRFNGQFFTNFTIDDGLAANYVKSISESKDGDLWFGTAGYGSDSKDGNSIGGLSWYDGSTFRNLTSKNGLPVDLVSSVTESKGGGMWIATLGGGLCHYDGEKLECITTKSGLADDRVQVVLEDGDGTLWAGTQGGVSRFDGKEWVSFDADDGLRSKLVTTMLFDREGYLWVGTEEGGISRYEGKYLQNYTSQHGLPGSWVQTVVQDQKSGLWIGTAQGLVRFVAGEFVLPPKTKGFPEIRVEGLYQDRSGGVWFGTEYGLGVYDGHRVTTYTTKDGLPHNWVSCLLGDRKGRLWIGTRFLGLSYYDGHGFTSFTTEQGLLHNYVKCLLEDSTGGLWVGTLGGLCRYDGSEFSSYTTAQGLPDNSVNCLWDDGNGSLWIGTSKGLSHYDGHTFVNYTSAQGLPYEGVGCLLRDREGYLWIGTGGGGLILFDGEVFQRISRHDGLVNDTILSLVQGDSGQIWATTPGGLISYRRNPNSPSVYISDVATTSRHGPVEEILLATNTNIAFEYGGGSTGTRFEGMAFQYRLKGYTPSWITTHARRVEFPGLPLGEYEFEVKSISRDLVYAANPASVKIRVHPPYGQMILVGFLLAAVGVGIFQTKRVVLRGIRLRQVNQALSEANKELFRVSQAKSSFLASMSHELRTPMNAILGFSQFLRGNQEGNLSGQQLSNLEVIGRNAGELLILIEQLLDLSRIEAGRMQVAPEYFEIREVVGESLAVVAPLVGEKGVVLWADYEVEYQVFYTDRSKVKQILVNLLSNAVKFTEEGRVGVWVKGEDGLVRLTVMDSGVGIAAEHLETIFEEFRQVRHPGMGQGTGLGLAITRRLCRLLGGEVSVASVPGQGSTFTVILPREFRSTFK